MRGSARGYMQRLQTGLAERRAEEIRDWYATLERGGSLRFGSDDYENSLMMATVRALNGLGADRSDANGELAMAEVRRALEAAAPGPPAPGRR